jgi:hypothetical protein
LNVVQGVWLSNGRIYSGWIISGAIAHFPLHPVILYLTYNDQPSGVYWSQVTDVVEYLNTLGGPKVKLLALVSGRDFFRTRKAIKAHSPSAWVIPMVPTMKRWKKNTAIVAWICRFMRPSGIICRGPFATWMTLRMRERGLTKRVCFDGRGAYAAEWEEYRIIADDALIAQFRPLEKEAVNAADFRIAVSLALVEHWRERYGYTSEAHAVIPCTLGTDPSRPRTGDPSGRRDTDPLTLVYSGSTAGWQSFSLLEKLLTQVLDRQPNARVLFLSKPDKHNAALQQRYPGRVDVQWLKAEEVGTTLQACDAGILVREHTITNRVASPTKFAEYLNAGLPVIISEHLGDFSELVRRERLGMVLSAEGHLERIERPSSSEREHLHVFAQQHFTKAAHNAAYRQLLSAMTT